MPGKRSGGSRPGPGKPGAAGQPESPPPVLPAFRRPGVHQGAGRPGDAPHGQPLDAALGPIARTSAAQPATVRPGWAEDPP